MLSHLNLNLYLNLLITLILLSSAYFLGSTSSAILICRLGNLPDPRDYGSKNPGTTNVLRIAGKALAAIVLVLDAGKGYLVVQTLKALAYPDLVVISGAVAVFLGHLFPIFFKFQGGKGVAITLGILFALNWYMAIGCLAIWVIIFISFKYSSLAAISAAVGAMLLSCFPVLNLAPVFRIGIVVLALLILLKHKTNIKNLLNNTEKKILRS